MAAWAAFFALVGAVSTLAATSPDNDLDALEKEFPEFHRGLMRYGRHVHKLRNGRHHSLLKHGHNLHHRQHLDLDLDLFSDDKPVEEPMRLPGRHPSVEKALDGMSDDLVKLRETKDAAKDTRKQLEGTVTDTFQHMNDKFSIKRALLKKEQELRTESGKLEALEKDAGRLEQTRDSLMESLHRMLDPKVMLARERFSKKDAAFHKEEEAARSWQERKEQLKAAAMETIKQKKASQQSLLEAEHEVAEAKKREELARIKYEHDRSQTAEKVQTYRYAETRYKAEMQHEKAAEQAATSARESVEKLQNVEQVEQEKVDQSILFRKDRLRARMQQVQQARQKSQDELNGLQQKYSDWRVQQEQRTADVMRKSQETAYASDAYQAKQQQVLDAAREKVVREAEGAGDWDSWGGDAFSNVKDEEDD